MKAKLMALILAAGLGITGIAGTALAAGTSTTDTCKHETLHHYEERGKSTTPLQATGHQACNAAEQRGM